MVVMRPGQKYETRNILDRHVSFSCFSVPKVAHETAPDNSQVGILDWSGHWFGQETEQRKTKESHENHPKEIIYVPKEYVRQRHEPHQDGLLKPTSHKHGQDKLAQPGLHKYSCNICPKSFSRGFCLEQHMIIHSEKRPFLCSFCLKAFKRKESLNNHVRIHTGEKPFSCHICQKVFTTRSNLFVHKRTHKKEQSKTQEQIKHIYDQEKSTHSEALYSFSFSDQHTITDTGERRYSCSVCKKSFRQKSVLNIHKRTHTGEKPFSCDVCQRAFSVKCNLDRHKNIHRTKPYRQRTTDNSQNHIHTIEQIYRSNSNQQKRIETCTDKERYDGLTELLSPVLPNFQHMYGGLTEVFYPMPPNVQQIYGGLGELLNSTPPNLPFAFRVQQTPNVIHIDKQNPMGHSHEQNKSKQKQNDESQEQQGCHTNKQWENYLTNKHTNKQKQNYESIEKQTLQTNKQKQNDESIGKQTIHTNKQNQNDELIDVIEQGGTHTSEQNHIDEAIAPGNICSEQNQNDETMEQIMTDKNEQSNVQFDEGNIDTNKHSDMSLTDTIMPRLPELQSSSRHRQEQKDAYTREHQPVAALHEQRIQATEKSDREYYQKQSSTDKIKETCTGNSQEQTGIKQVEQSEIDRFQNQMVIYHTGQNLPGDALDQRRIYTQTESHTGFKTKLMRYDGQWRIQPKQSFADYSTADMESHNYNTEANYSDDSGVHSTIFHSASDNSIKQSRIPTDVHQISCSMCLKTFNNKIGLVKHIKMCASLRRWISDQFIEFYQ